MPTDSNWGAGAATLSDPAGSSSPGARDDSAWSSLNRTLTGPSGPPQQYSDSAWAAATAALSQPHRPIGVWDGTTIRYIPIFVWTGVDSSVSSTVGSTV